jgi:hypothetical protein
MVAGFFAEVEGGGNLGEGEQTLNPLNSLRVWRGKVDYTTAMARLIAAWRKRWRCQRQVAEALKGLTAPPAEMRCSTLHVDRVRA